MSNEDTELATENNLNKFVFMQNIPFTNYIFSNNQELAKIDPDGILTFCVAADDENAKKFIECMERIFNRNITGIKIEHPNGD